jgi:hypothetical protein
MPLTIFLMPTAEILGIIDEVITLQWLSLSENSMERAFICTSPSEWAYPAKDRSGCSIN